MSKRTRALILGATLAAMNLAGMTAVAQAQATNEGKDTRQPPTERQVGESWRHHQVAPESDDHRPGRPAGTGKAAVLVLPVDAHFATADRARADRCGCRPPAAAGP
jgi:hypothetical protein